MEFEGIICPACASTLDEESLQSKFKCPHCGTNFYDKKYIAFIEYLVEQGIISNIDFFDKKLYGDEIQLKTVEEKELDDETNPDEYEDKVERHKYIEDNPDQNEKKLKFTDEEEFRDWKGLDEDWEEFNKKNEK